MAKRKTSTKQSVSDSTAVDGFSEDMALPIRYYRYIDQDERVRILSSNLPDEYVPDNYVQLTEAAYNGFMSRAEELPHLFLRNGDIVYEPPVLPDPPVPFTMFLDQFSQDEQESIASAAMTDVKVKLWYDKAVANNMVLPEDDGTKAAMDLLHEKHGLTKTTIKQALKRPKA